MHKNVPDSIKDLGIEYGITDVLLMEPVFIAKQSYDVTYETDDVDFPQCVYGSETLSQIFEKAQKAKELSITLFGDSISNGANCSHEGGYSPNEGPWFDNVVKRLEREEKGWNVMLTNRSRSGYGTVWGESVSKEIWADIEDDVFIVAFGMNDGTDGLSADDYISNIRKILQNRKNPLGAFILISSILPNPDSQFYRHGLRFEYAKRLKMLCSEMGGAFVDMTTLSEYLLNRKLYCDISGNNFNHPNDFVYRFYEDAIYFLLTSKVQTLV